jgi:NAD-dependent dihydropyrimidine dehydrogenase PreA subunit
MIDERAYVIPEPTTHAPLTFDPEICIGCNICVDICQVDILLPNPEVGEPPIVVYPDECWYDGSCVSACPEPAAITLNNMAGKQVCFRRKESGEDFYT